MKHFHVFTIFAVALMLSIAPAFAKGDLATRAKKLEPLLLGSAESDYAMSVKEYELESGKACPPTPPGRRLAVAVGQRERGFRVRHIVFLDAPLSLYSECDIEQLMPDLANVAGRC